MPGQLAPREEGSVRPSWDEWALGLAEAVSTRADCTRAQVGAVILSRKHRVIGLGYNGLPPGLPGCASAGNCPRGLLSVEECERDSNYANCAATHAERNAIEDVLDKGIPAYELQAATLYATRRPCPACNTLIASAGIRRVVVLGEENAPKCSPLVGLFHSMQSRAASFLA
ncbi:deaminase [Streptomyces sp. STCH 565 A]|uniref:deoxycytidylate deaminase n=1 Tax=Streptomyces sp. STCH 565 A TaxID=2950532 RepID=UPI002074F70A|nr:deaminase [Streptomyces sp. STCH 565 A]MCM8548805.1 deaminase [Streptomyces sp. STCH 565 A]